MNDLVKKLIGDNQALLKKQYESLVVAEIRKKYSQDEENAILRKKLGGLDNGEFDTYNEYVEGCKLLAKTIVYK
ncbi:MAG: hypothetical protein ACI35S_05250 [Anaeroplasma sp.]